jgi:biofilm PGA synthesis N-glycosyltransferase PgaC
MPDARYVIVSPMKNEEKYVAKTLEAMVAQTVKPLEWVIVNDGSTDRSEEIVAGYCARYPWIRQLNLAGLGARQPEHYGGHVVDLIYDGVRHIETKDYDFIVKLDCDVSFAPTFFEMILDTCRQHPRLGITSGVSFAVLNGVLAEEKAAPDHTLGATKVYRRTCFEEIGGLVASMGWDGIDEMKARMLGWEAWPLRLMVMHHRPEGLALGLMASGIERGKGSYFMGYHPLFMIFRCLLRMLKPGLATDGVGMLIGYFSCWFRGDSRVPDENLIRYLRRQQIRRLLLRRTEA